MNGELQPSHDSFFKFIFKNPKNVRDFLEAFFPEIVKDFVDFMEELREDFDGFNR